MPDVKILKDWTSGRIVLIYIVVAGLWIFLSDEVLVWFGRETEKITYYQTIKGLFFVLTTAAMLYALINRGIQKIRNSKAAEQEVKRRYMELVENANDFIYTLDLSGRFTSVNRSGEKILGYSRTEMLELDLEDIVASKYKPLVQKFSRKSKSDGALIYEAEFIKKNNDKVLLEVSSRQIIEDEKTVGLQGIARDITERHIAEENLKQSEARYRDLIATANEGIVIINQEGIITFVNQKICEMLDYDSEELIGNYIFDFMSDALRSEAEQKMEHQKAGFKERFDFKFRRLGGDELWTSVSANPIFKDNEYTGFLGMITDITDHKLAEAALLKEKSINDSMIDSLPGIFYLYDNAGKFLRWNRNFEKVSGYSSEEMKNMHPLDFFIGAEKQLIEERINEVFEKGDSSVEANFVSKDGTQTPYYFTGKRIMIDDLECLVGMGIDISNRSDKS